MSRVGFSEISLSKSKQSIVTFLGKAKCEVKVVAVAQTKAQTQMLIYVAINESQLRRVIEANRGDSRRLARRQRISVAN